MHNPSSLALQLCSACPALQHRAPHPARVLPSLLAARAVLGTQRERDVWSHVVVRQRWLVAQEADTVARQLHLVGWQTQHSCQALLELTHSVLQARHLHLHQLANELLIALHLRHLDPHFAGARVLRQELLLRREHKDVAEARALGIGLVAWHGRGCLARGHGHAHVHGRHGRPHAHARWWRHHGRHGHGRPGRRRWHAHAWWGHGWRHGWPHAHLLWGRRPWWGPCRGGRQRP
mmetsp:Transcript_23345/g.59752  ORF Transcript_23345/g.59752 Transcript_23345/m.59752 type:complete len:234 (-) Transcript_23345:1759-2460(-)